MKIPFNTACFDLVVKVNSSGETGKITGFCLHQRSKQKQFYVEYQAADGRHAESWFFEDQLHAV